MAYVLKIRPDGLSVWTPDGSRALSDALPSIREAAWTDDGRGIRTTTHVLPFRAFTALDDLDAAARELDRERSIKTEIRSSGRGLRMKLAYSTFRDRTHPVSEAELAALAKRHGPPPVWVAEIPEIDALAERLGPLWPETPDLGGPRIQLSRLDGAWTIQWWPRGGGMDSRESLRDVLAIPGTP